MYRRLDENIQRLAGYYNNKQKDGSNSVFLFGYIRPWLVLYRFLVDEMLVCAGDIGRACIGYFSNTTLTFSIFPPSGGASFDTVHLTCLT